MNDLKNAKLNLKKAQTMMSSDLKKDSPIELFADTYWYKNQFYFFKQNFNELNKLLP